jgi:hypothetical protein
VKTTSAVANGAGRINTAVKCHTVRPSTNGPAPEASFRVRSMDRESST